MVTETKTQLPLMLAALELRLDYQGVLRRVLRGELNGRKEGTRWIVERDSRFNALLETQRHAA